MCDNEVPYHETVEYNIICDGFQYMEGLGCLNDTQFETYIENVKVMLRHIVSNVIMESGGDEAQVRRGLKDLEREDYYLYAGEER